MFGENLKRLRKSRGLTQAQLASCLDISASAVGMYEQGRREPDTNTIKRICSEFHISTDYLLGMSSIRLPNSDLKKNNSNDIEVHEVIDEFTDFLRAQKGLMFNGYPVSKKDRENIVNAIKVAAAVAVSVSRINKNKDSQF